MSRRLQRHLDRLAAEHPPRAKSLIVTMFGDAVLPHGGSIWLGSLIALAAPFAINDRLVRTAVLRLSREGWLEARPVGRRSAYAATATGLQRIEDAYRRIYAAGPQRWDGSWCLVLVPPDGLAKASRDALRRELGWLGFGLIGPNVMLHPSPDRATLDHALRRLDGGARVTVIEGAAATGAPRDLVDACWDLREVEAGYQEFLERFRPAWAALESGEPLDDATCFRLRILLIHDYRRAVLRDPLLPAELLAPDWPGNAARALCRNIYRAIEAAAECHLEPMLRNAEGPLPALGVAYYQRFGGLDARTTA